MIKIDEMCGRKVDKIMGHIICVIKFNCCILRKYSSTFFRLIKQT